MVSIIITVREQYAYTVQSVTAILSGLDKKVNLVFVAGKAPGKTIAFLKGVSKTRRNFTLVQVDRFLRPNEARNMGLEKIKPGADVVFIENDVVPRPGWLTAILRCARETKAEIVAPLIFEGDPKDSDLTIHAGGANFKKRKLKNGGSEIYMDHFLKHGKRDWRELRRSAWDDVEFHCLFIRRKLLDQIGLDGNFDTLYGHVDLCFDAKKRGAKIMMEPAAHVVFINPALMSIKNRFDFEIFIEKWKESVIRESTAASGKKWGMDPRGHFLWMHRYFAFWDKSMVFSSLNILTKPELFLWRAIRVKICPEWVREWLERYLVARIRAGAWK